MRQILMMPFELKLNEIYNQPHEEYIMLHFHPGESATNAIKNVTIETKASHIE